MLGGRRTQMAMSRLRALRSLRLRHFKLRTTNGLSLHSKFKLIIAAAAALNYVALWALSLPAYAILLVILAEVYVLIPLIVFCSHTIRNSIVFMTWAGPKRRKAKRALEPGKEGVRCQSRLVYIETPEGHELGCWEILSEAAPPVETDDEWTEAWRQGDALRPVFLLLHGQGGHRGGKTRVGQCNMLSALGFHVLSFDYRGFGDSTGSPTPEGVVHDTVYAFQHLKERAAAHPIIIYGHSLGTGIAARAAELLVDMEDPPSGLILDAAFSSLTAALRTHTLFMPYRVHRRLEALMLSAFDKSEQGFPSDAHIAALDCPILILHAKDDPLIPWGLAEQLRAAAAAASRRVELVLFDSHLRLGHNSVHTAPQIPLIFRNYMARGGWAGEILIPLNEDETQSTPTSDQSR